MPGRLFGPGGGCGVWRLSERGCGSRPNNVLSRPNKPGAPLCSGRPLAGWLRAAGGSESSSGNQRRTGTAPAAAPPRAPSRPDAAGAVGRVAVLDDRAVVQDVVGGVAQEAHHVGGVVAVAPEEASWSCASSCSIPMTSASIQGGASSIFDSRPIDHTGSGGSLDLRHSSMVVRSPSGVNNVSPPGLK